MTFSQMVILVNEILKAMLKELLNIFKASSPEIIRDNTQIRYSPVSCILGVWKMNELTCGDRDLLITY